MKQTQLVWALLALACAAVPACNGDDADDTGRDAGAARCLAPLSLDCDPTFQPTYDAIYDNLLSRTCGAPSTGGSCHGPEGMQGGLVLLGRVDAYDNLLGEGDAPARVVPGDPECSLLVQRLESTDPQFVMPRGMRLSEGQRCAVRQWVAAGAEKQ